MTSKKIVTQLPQSIIEKIESTGATIKKGGKLWIIVLETPTALQVHSEFLSSNEEVDPVLFPAFGDPIAPYVPPAVQREIFYLIHCFQPLLRDAFVAHSIPYNFIPDVGGYQYHTQMAIQKVQQEIQHPQMFANSCPFLAAVMGGQILCDLQIVYANCMVVARIRKF